MSDDSVGRLQGIVDGAVRVYRIAHDLPVRRAIGGGLCDATVDFGLIELECFAQSVHDVALQRERSGGVV